MSEDNGGGSIRMDPRVTSVANWFWNFVQLAMVAALGFVANNLYQVNLTLAANAAESRAVQSSIVDIKDLVSDHERRLEGLSGRVYVLEGKTMRGVPNEHQ